MVSDELEVHEIPGYAQITRLPSAPRDEPPIEEPEPEEEPASPFLEIRSISDALADPPPEPEELIRGLLRRQELLVLAAPRGIGKSHAAMQLAWLLGQGEGRFFGALPVARQARVLIAQGELDQWGTWKRWQHIAGTHTPPEGVYETFDRWRVRATKVRTTLRDQGGSDTSEWLDAHLDPRLEQTIVANDIDVLVIDPWAVFYAGAENSNDETEAALDKLRDLAMRTGVAIVIIHHLSKALEVKEPEDAWRGASRLADWASTRVTLLPHYTDKQATDQGMTRQQARRYVDVKMLRRHEPTEDFSISFDPETLWWNHWRPPEAAADERRVRLNPIDIEEACRNQGGNWPSVKAAAITLGISEAVARRHLDEAVRTQYLTEYRGTHGARGFRIVSTPEEPF